MKKLVLAAAVLMMMPAAASAQVTDTKTATVSANVMSALSLTKVTDINFGIVSVSQTATINAAAPTAGQTAGKFSAAGQSGASILLTFSVTTQPTNGTFTPAVRANATDDASASTATTSGSSHTLTGGARFFYVGGDLAATATPGAASGVFSMTVAYN